MTDEQVLIIKDLNISFQDKKGWIEAVNGLSYTLKKGSTLGIVGESGSGKSVSSLSILGLLSSNNAKIEGEILFNNGGNVIDLLKIPKDDYHTYRGKKIAMIFQEPMSSLNPSMTCGKQVDEAILLHDTNDKKEAKKRTLDLFNRVKLPEPERIYNAYPHQLSGGQIQRVMISMAISCHPMILIADEPTTALDVTVQKEVIELLKEIQQEYRMAMIFISHDLGVIKQIAEDVLVMKSGIVQEYGKITEVFNHPKSPYTRGLIACRPPLEFKMKRLPTIDDFMSDESMTAEKFKQKFLSSYNLGLENKQAILEVKGLSTWYVKKKNFWGKPIEYVKALNNVSFHVNRGECLGILGESGSGKSTLSKTIMMLEKSREGEILFEGRDILNLEKHQVRELRKELQIIFQDPYSSLNPRLSIGYAISEPLLVHKICRTRSEARAQAEYLLEQVGLKPEHYDRYPHEFSGGQRQRIVIARTIGLKPKFIICDECVSALDVSIQAQIVNLLLDLKEKFDLSYIFISHDLAVVQFISDRILVMKEGNLVESGDTYQIINSPKTEYTRTLLDSIPK